MDEKTIKNELARIRGQIRAGDDSELWVWVIPGRLACSQRPLRYHPDFDKPGRPPLPPQARPIVVQWVDRVVAAGFQAIISLLEIKQLERHYVRGGLNLHPKGLLGYYESRGLQVKSIPCTDYNRPSKDKMAEALSAFRIMRKPALLHCSAGIDRSTPVAAFIEACEGTN